VTGLLIRDDRILLVATRYAGRREPLWNLPGGRARTGELLPHALRREFAEETGLAAAVGALRFVAESYDPVGAVHVTSTTFAVEADGAAVRTADPSIVDLAWVPRAELPARITIAVVREPLLAALADDPRRYFGYADAGVTLRFSTEP